MKKFSKVLSAALAVSMVATSLSAAMGVSAATPAAANLRNTTLSATKTLAEGVTYTQMTAAAGAYHSSQSIEFNVVEIDMSTENLYLETQYGGSRAYHDWNTNIDGMVSEYNAQNTDKSALAAINADLWWMYVGSQVEPANGGKALLSEGGSYSTSLGFTMADGEIYTSDRMVQENYVSGTGGTSLPYEDYISFGITSDYVPVISNPNAAVSITNNTKGTTANADGINRTPAYNSLVMYTDKGPSEIYANDDAYQVKIKITSTADYVIGHGTDITGTVEGVYAPGGSDPSIAACSNYIVLTARGSQYSSISGYAIGDEVNIKVSVYDQSGKYNEQWQKVTDAVAGHYLFTADGVATSNVAANETYPSTFIGITNSGNVVMFTIGATVDGVRYGSAQSKYEQIAKDLDLKDCFMLDGGGSSNMVIKDGDNYVRANNSQEPDRVLLNSIILATGSTRSAQGEIPSVPQKSPADKIDFSNSADIGYINGVTNDAKYMLDGDALKLTSVAGNDPYVTINYGLSSSVLSADDYDKITIKYMIPTTNTAAAYSGTLFLQTGSVTEANGSYTVPMRDLIRDGQYHEVVVELSNAKGWSGNINAIRLDFFDGCGAGDTMYVKSITLAADAPTTSAPPTTTATATATSTATATTTATMSPSATAEATASDGISDGVSDETPSASAGSSSVVNTPAAGTNNGTDAGSDADKEANVETGDIAVVSAIALLAIISMAAVILKKRGIV